MWKKLIKKSKLETLWLKHQTPNRTQNITTKTVTKSFKTGKYLGENGAPSFNHWMETSSKDP